MSFHQNPENYIDYEDFPYNDFTEYDETTSCYMDGRYFNSVFAKYPGLCTEPIHLRFMKDGDYSVYDIYMNHCHIHEDEIVLVKVNIEIGNYTHCGLLLIHPEEYGERCVTFFDPVEMDKNYDRISNQMVVERIGDIIRTFLTPSLPNMVFETRIKTVKKPVTKCIISGYCVAHIIMHALHCLHGDNFPCNHGEIKRFVSMVENNFSLCPHCPPQIEYGHPDSTTTGLVLGGLGGAAIGGALGGSTGFLVGGATGALGGYALGSLSNR